MTKGLSLLVPIFGKRWTLEKSLFLRNVLVVSKWFSGEVLLLASDTLDELIKERIGVGARVRVETENNLDVDAINKVLDEGDFQLMVLENNVGLRKEVLEQSGVPVLLISGVHKLPDPPIEAFLVPVSGEERESKSLGGALRLAAYAGVRVDLVHVSGNVKEGCACGEVLERLGDEYQHEYPEMLDKVVSGASPYSSLRERACIRTFFHCTGLTVTEIEKLLSKRPNSALVMEWQGSLAPGHATLLKEVLRSIDLPLLLVRSDLNMRDFLMPPFEFRRALG